jgi:hypothetical protein
MPINDVRIELANANHSSLGPHTRPCGRKAHRAMPDGLDQFGGVGRRRAGELGADTAARGADDLRAFERRAYDQDGLTDDSRMRGRPCGSAEVHAQVAVAVFVSALTEAVGRIGTQRYDQRNGRDKRDQTNAEETRAQGGGSYLSGDKEA